jgi:2'-5' RNA ligase
VSRACAEVAARLPPASLKPVSPELMHLTLAFVGYVPEAIRAPAEAALRAALTDRAAFRARLGGLGTFPSPRRPRVVWVGLAEGADEVRAVAEAVRQELTVHGVPFDDAPPVAHLTVARLRDEAPVEVRAALGRAVAALSTAIPPLEFAVDEARLYESRLSPRGPTYLPLARAPLQAQTP